MYLFVDESGTNKQSGYSVFAVIIVEDHDIAGLNELILAAEATARTQSFHWKSTPWPVRKAFMKEVSKGQYRVAFSYHKNPVKNFAEALETTIVTAARDLEISRIVLDGRKSKGYEKSIKKTLRDQGLSSRKLRTADDESYPLLRLADAFAGLLRHHTDKPSDHSKIIYAKVRKKLQ
jgi:hypothetical protein